MAVRGCSSTLASACLLDSCLHHQDAAYSLERVRAQACSSGVVWVSLLEGPELVESELEGPELVESELEGPELVESELVGLRLVVQSSVGAEPTSRIREGGTDHKTALPLEASSVVVASGLRCAGHTANGPSMNVSRPVRRYRPLGPRSLEQWR